MNRMEKIELISILVILFCVVLNIAYINDLRQTVVRQTCNTQMQCCPNECVK